MAERNTDNEDLFKLLTDTVNDDKATQKQISRVQLTITGVMLRKLNVIDGIAGRVEALEDDDQERMAQRQIDLKRFQAKLVMWTTLISAGITAAGLITIAVLT